MKTKNKNEDYQYVRISDTKKYYQTQDFLLSVTLLCNGFLLETIEVNTKGKHLFIFRNDEQMAGFIERYFANKLLVNPVEYENARKNLKSRVYSQIKM